MNDLLIIGVSVLLTRPIWKAIDKLVDRWIEWRENATVSTSERGWR
jgi:hypothetical protein